MKISEFQNRLIDYELRIITRGYCDEPDKRNGAVAGLTQCRGKSMEELKQLIVGANSALSKAYADKNPRYWEIAMFHMEVEHVCDVMSAMYRSQGMEPIIEPSKGAYDLMLALMAGSASITFEKKPIPKHLHS